MARLRHVVMLTVVAAATACVTGGQYQSELDLWIGLGEERLVDQFGPPVEVVANVDGRTLKWESATEVKDSTTAPVGGGLSIGFSSTIMQYCRLSAHLAADGTATGFEWKATQSSPFNKDQEVAVRFDIASACAKSFPAKAQAVKPDARLEPWKGRSEDDLRAAYAAPPNVYVSDDETRWLTWSDLGSRSGVGVPQQPNSEATTTRKTTSLCSVNFAVVGGIVDRYSVRGRRGCPMPKEG